MVSPPPVLKTWVVSPHLGQTNPLMFSTTPSTGMSVFWQKRIERRTSAVEIRWGVVTMTAPSTGAASWQTESGSSPVPGGRSTTRQSRSPQATSSRNWRITVIFIGPRQTTGSSALGSRKPMDITLSPEYSSGNSASPSPTTRACSRCSIWGMLGPWMSTSSRPTRWPASIRCTARLVATVLLPTPPLPDITMILRRIWPMRC